MFFFSSIFHHNVADDPIPANDAFLIFQIQSAPLATAQMCAGQKQNIGGTTEAHCTRIVMYNKSLIIILFFFFIVINNNVVSAAAAASAAAGAGYRHHHGPFTAVAATVGYHVSSFQIVHFQRIHEVSQFGVVYVQLVNYRSGNSSSVATLLGNLSQDVSDDPRQIVHRSIAVDESLVGDGGGRVEFRVQTVLVEVGVQIGDVVVEEVLLGSRLVVQMVETPTAVVTSNDAAKAVEESVLGVFLSAHEDVGIVARLVGSQTSAHRSVVGAFLHGLVVLLLPQRLSFPTHKIQFAADVVRSVPEMAERATVGLVAGVEGSDVVH